MTALFSSAEHWRHYADFCRWEMASGGPDPQLKMVAGLADLFPPTRTTAAHFADRVWAGGCYISVYNVPFGELLWQHWPLERVTAEPEALEPWLREHWRWIVTRQERRTVRRPEWLAQFLLGYAGFTRCYPALIVSTAGLSSAERYQVVWDAALEVPRLGRYVAMNLLEYLRIGCGLEAECPDIRAEGGWSPRLTLAELFPADAERLTGGDSAANIALVNARVAELRQRLRDDFGLEVPAYALEVCLCEYRQSWEGRRQYPGRSLDSELGYMRKRADLTGGEPASRLAEVRAAIFPPEHLGERQGWAGPRADCGAVLATYGYTWTDLRFDFGATVSFAQPAERIL